MGFARFKPQREVVGFCEQVARQCGVLLLPGTVYDEPGHLRFGYGRKNMPEALAQFAACLDTDFEFTGMHPQAGTAAV